jgi:gluconolactonase
MEPQPTFKPAAEHVVCEGLNFPEGPTLDREGNLYVVDIQLAGLFRIENGEEPVLVAELGGGPNGATLAPDGSIWVANCGGYDRPVREMAAGRPGNRSGDGSIQRVDLATGEVTVIASDCDGDELGECNDLVFDAAGNCYFTNSRKGNVCFIGADGKVRKIAEGLVFSNGLALTGDESRLLVAETFTGVIYRYPIEEPGVLGPRTGHALMPMNPAPWPDVRDGADGLKVGAGDVLFAAGCHGGEVVLFDSRGAQIESMQFSGAWITNLCFAHGDPSTILVTDAMFGRVLSRPLRHRGPAQTVRPY